MSKLILPTLVLSLALWLILGSFWLGKQNTENRDDKAHSEKPALLIEHDTFKVFSNTIFAFAPFEADLIINDEQMEAFDALALYLDRTPKKQLLLSGFHGPKELLTNSSGNLGLTRANSIKNILVRRGAPEEQVKVEGKLKGDLTYNENGLISGAVIFDIFDREQFEISKQKITFELAYDQAEIDQTKEIEKSVVDLKQWLADHPESRLRITVYFEDIIIRSIAQEKATIVKDFFINKGIAADRIDPFSIEKRAINPKNGSAIQKNNITKVEAEVY